MDDPALLSLALWPKTDADQDRLTDGLRRLIGEDPTLRVQDGRSTGEVVIAAVGELQLEVVIDRLKREFNVEAGVGRPQVAYKEAFTRAADGEMKYAEKTGDRRQYAHVRVHVYPGEPGSGYVFENQITSGAIPNEFIRPVDEGVKEALTRGVLAGYPVDDIRIELYDGSYHDADSSAVAFKIAGAMAFQDAAQRARPVLLEPVMRVEVVVPLEYAVGVVASLSSRRAQIQSRKDRGRTQTIRARVCLSDMFGYSSDLRERTRGRGAFVMQFDRYQPVRRAEDDGADGSRVGAPRWPRPTPKKSREALPEPEGGTPGD